MHRSIIWLMIGAPVTLIIVAAGVAATVPKTIETQIAIKASPSKVWSILTDFSAMPSWNPFITAISGDVLPGSRLSVTIAPPGQSGMRHVQIMSAPESNITLKKMKLGQKTSDRLWDLSSRSLGRNSQSWTRTWPFARSIHIRSLP